MWKFQIKLIFVSNLHVCVFEEHYELEIVGSEVIIREKVFFVAVAAAA